MNKEDKENVVRIKRKRIDNPLEAFVVEKPNKYPNNAIEDIVEKFSFLGSETCTSMLQQNNETDKLQDNKKKNSEIKTLERKLFRLAFTITDLNKIKEFGRGLQELQSQKSRNKAIQMARSFEKENEKVEEEASKNEDFVIDVYYRDTKVNTNELDIYETVNLESYQENLMFEAEQNYASDHDSEDSNAKEFDYPDESNEECSDDSSDGPKKNDYRSAFDDSEEDYYEANTYDTYNRHPYSPDQSD